MQSTRDSILAPPSPHTCPSCVPHATPHLVLQAIRKWCLLVLTELLSDPTIKQWALPWGTALQPLQVGSEDALTTLESLAALLAGAISR